MNADEKKSSGLLAAASEIADAKTGETTELSMDDFLSDDADNPSENDTLTDISESEPQAETETQTESETETPSLEDIKKELESARAEIEQEKNLAKEKLKQKALEEREKKKAHKPLFSIGAKLILIVTTLLLSALGAVTAAVTYFSTEDVRASSEENNLSINARTASDCENRIENAAASVNLLFDLMKAAGDNETEIRALESMFFSKGNDVVAVYAREKSLLLANDVFFVSNERDRAFAQEFFLNSQESFDGALSGDFVLANASSFFGFPVLAMFYVFEDNTVGVLYSLDKMAASFSSGSVNQSMFVNADGVLLVQSDVQAMLDGADEKNNAIVHEMLTSAQNNSQITYIGEDGAEYIGAFRKLSGGKGAVITTVRTSVVLEGVNAMKRRNIFITLAILSISIMIVYFFSQSMARPLKALTAVANEINQGNFNTDLFSALVYKSKDEIGILENSTKNERDILNMVAKLTNKGVTRAVITKEIDFEPHLKDITIFFSDIRGFTAISDGFKNRFGEKSAAEIIGFLNDYMSRMVTCISLTGGVVDKFEGDAIMACWGVLRNDDLNWEQKGEGSVTRALKQDAHDKYVRDDAISAITCCIAMRYSLAKYNKDAEAFTKAHEGEPLAQYKPHIRIGAGLNSGRATVGFMGSYEKMEFTSIGDAVNFASRTEASNKPCGTDILITEDTYNLLKNDFIRCEENNFTLKAENLKREIVVERIPVGFEVKGKGVQHFYGVVNMPRFDIEEFFKAGDPNFEIDQDCEKVVGPFGPRTLKEMRELLGIPEPDFGQVNLNEEENKIQVASS